VDLSGGTVMQFYQSGGPVMHALLACSLIGLVFIIERAWSLYRAKINTQEFLDRVRTALLKRRNVKEAVTICEEYGGPIANIMKAGLLKYGRPQEEIERTIEAASAHELSRLERGLSVIATVANIAPLLGFLGTVSGMINSFDALARAGLSNPGLVAKGISEALITTATGLAVAIPMLVAYNYFTSRVSKFVLEMETSANVLLETYSEMEDASGGSA
jgi:biopolymer transport protein ExbB